MSLILSGAGVYSIWPRTINYHDRKLPSQQTKCKETTKRPLIESLNTSLCHLPRSLIRTADTEPGPDLIVGIDDGDGAFFYWEDCSSGWGGLVWRGRAGLILLLSRSGTDRADRDGSEILLWTVREGHRLHVHCWHSHLIMLPIDSAQYLFWIISPALKFHDVLSPNNNRSSLILNLYLLLAIIFQNNLIIQFYWASTVL